jgi:DNA-binding response OmpR family regulator
MQEEVGKLSHCLIAESDQFIAKLLLRYAEGSELVCVRAKIGEDVVSLARELRPVVIIIDAEFPGDLVGWEIIRNLKAGDDTRHIALISCSWMSQAEVHSLVGNLTGYLQKPNISYGDFERAIQAAGVLMPVSSSYPQLMEWMIGGDEE